MVIAFEEKDRKPIEATGMTIAEFKRNLYRIANNVYNVGEITVTKIKKAWKAFKIAFLKAIDNVKFMVEQAMEAWHYPTSRRYRIVKILSKCTGIEKLKLWKMTRHTWLARSNC